MNPFTRIVTEVCFHLNLARLAGDPTKIDGQDFEKIGQSLNLTEKEMESLQVVRDIALKDKYLTPETIREGLVKHVLKPASEKKGLHPYVLFKKYFGGQVKWDLYFPDINKARSEVIGEIIKKFDPTNKESYIDSDIFDINFIINNYLASDGVSGLDFEHKFYYFRESGCFVFGPAETTSIHLVPKSAKEVSRFEYLSFEEFKIKECVAKRKELPHLAQHKDSQYDEFRTIAVFKPRFRSKLSEALSYLPAFIQDILTDMYAEYSKNHEIGHIVNDDKTIDIVMFVAHAELAKAPKKMKKIFRSNRDDLNRLLSIYKAAMEIAADRYAIENTLFGRALFRLKIAENADKKDMMHCLSFNLNSSRREELSRIYDQFGKFKKEIAIVVLKFLESNQSIFDQIIQDIYVKQSEETKKIFNNLPKVTKRRIIFNRVAERFWSDNRNHDIMKELSQRWWQILSNLQNEVCEKN